MFCHRCGTLVAMNEERYLEIERDEDGTWLGQRAFHNECPLAIELPSLEPKGPAFCSCGFDRMGAAMHHHLKRSGHASVL